MTLKSPLAKVLGSGSAKEGTDHWWAQRVSAIALLVLGLWFAVSLISLHGFEHNIVSDWAARPFNSVMLLSLCLTLAWHSSLGVQVVIEDYVHGSLLKVLSLIANKLLHLVLVIAAIYAALSIALGSGV